MLVSRGWSKASACRLQITISCAFLCHIGSLQYLSRSSLHRLAGLPCRLFLSSLRRLIYPAQDHFIFLTVLIISTRRVPVEGKSSVCLIFIKYMILILIIIIISLGQIYYYRILQQTHHARTHALARAHTHARVHTHTHTPLSPPPYMLALFICDQPPVTDRSAGIHSK